MNCVILMGRLVRDPEVRYATKGNGEALPIARYTLAVNRGTRASNAEQNADFIRIVSFDKAAEFVEKYLRQGTKVVITGRIQTGSYTDRDGKKVYTTEIITSDIEFAESKRASDAYNSSNSYSQNDNRGAQRQTADAYDGFMNIPDGFDEELPFA